MYILVMYTVNMSLKTNYCSLMMKDLYDKLRPMLYAVGEVPELQGMATVITSTCAIIKCFCIHSYQHNQNQSQSFQTTSSPC